METKTCSAFYNGSKCISHCTSGLSCSECEVNTGCSDCIHLSECKAGAGPQGKNFKFVEEKT